MSRSDFPILEVSGLEGGYGVSAEKESPNNFFSNRNNRS